MKIYTAARSDVCISSMTFNDARLHWTQDYPADDGIHSVIPSHPDPQGTHEIRPALQAQNGIGIIENTAYWTAIDKVFKSPFGGSQSTVRDMGTTDRRLKGLTVVNPYSELHYSDRTLAGQF